MVDVVVVDVVEVVDVVDVSLRLAAALLAACLLINYL